MVSYRVGGSEISSYKGFNYVGSFSLMYIYFFFFLAWIANENDEIYVFAEGQKCRNVLMIKPHSIRKWVRCWWGTKSLPYLLAIFIELHATCTAFPGSIQIGANYDHSELQCTHTHKHMYPACIPSKTLQNTSMKFHQQMKRRQLSSNMESVLLPRSIK